MAAPASLLAAIRRLHRRGVPLNITFVKRHHPQLIETAFAARPFLGWKGALEAAGLDYSRIRIQLEDTVTCELCGQRRRSLPSHLTRTHGTDGAEYREAYPDAALLSETMRAALRSSVRHRMPHWEPLLSAEYVLDRIAAQWRQGFGMSVRAVVKDEQPLHSGATRYIGSWDRALVMAGIDPAAARRQIPKQHLSSDDVVHLLRERRRQGLALTERAVMDDDLRLANAARRRFGTYAAALRRAGIDPRSVAKRHPAYGEHDRERLLRAVRAVAQRRGMARLAAARQLRRKHVRVAEKLYSKAWRKVARAAGVPYNTIATHLSAAETLEVARARLALGRPLVRKTAEIKDHDLYRGVRRYFRTFAALHRRLGVKYDHHPRRRRADKTEILAEIARRRRSGKPLNCGAQHRDFRGRAVELFGSWDATLRAAGLDPGVMRQDRGAFRSKEAVLAEIRTRRRAGLPLTFDAVRGGRYAVRGLGAAAKRFYGGWSRALAAAGVRPYHG